MDATQHPKPPRKPLTPYMRFSKGIWAQVKERNQTMSVCEIGASIGKMWRELTDEQKQKYNEDFVREKAEYDVKIQEYLKMTGLSASDLTKSKSKKKDNKRDNTAAPPAGHQAQNPMMGMVGQHYVPPPGYPGAPMMGHPGFPPQTSNPSASGLPHFSQIWTGQPYDQNMQAMQNMMAMQNAHMGMNGGAFAFQQQQMQQNQQQQQSPAGGQPGADQVPGHPGQAPTPTGQVPQQPGQVPQQPGQVPQQPGQVPQQQQPGQALPPASQAHSVTQPGQSPIPPADGQQPRLNQFNGSPHNGSPHLQSASPLSASTASMTTSSTENTFAQQKAPAPPGQGQPDWQWSPSQAPHSVPQNPEGGNGTASPHSATTDEDKKSPVAPAVSQVSTSQMQQQFEQYAHPTAHSVYNSYVSNPALWNGPKMETKPESNNAGERIAALESEVLHLRTALSEKTKEAQRLSQELETAFRTIDQLRAAQNVQAQEQ